MLRTLGRSGKCRGAVGRSGLWTVGCGLHMADDSLLLSIYDKRFLVGAHLGTVML